MTMNPRSPRKPPASITAKSKPKVKTRAKTKAKAKVKAKVKAKKTRGAPPGAPPRSPKPTSTATRQVPPPLPDGEDDVDAGAGDGEDGAGDEGEGEEGGGDGEEDDAATTVSASPAVPAADSRDVAATRLGRTLAVHLEALHVADPRRAVAVLEEVVTTQGDLTEIAADLDTLDAADLARDVRLAVDRQRQRASR